MVPNKAYASTFFWNKHHVMYRQYRKLMKSYEAGFHRVVGETSHAYSWQSFSDSRIETKICFFTAIHSHTMQSKSSSSINNYLRAWQEHVFILFPLTINLGDICPVKPRNSKQFQFSLPITTTISFLPCWVSDAAAPSCSKVFWVLRWDKCAEERNLKRFFSRLVGFALVLVPSLGQDPKWYTGEHPILAV